MCVPHKLQASPLKFRSFAWHSCTFPCSWQHRSGSPPVQSKPTPRITAAEFVKWRCFCRTNRTGLICSVLSTRFILNDMFFTGLASPCFARDSQYKNIQKQNVAGQDTPKHQPRKSASNSLRVPTATCLFECLEWRVINHSYLHKHTFTIFSQCFWNAVWTLQAESWSLNEVTPGSMSVSTSLGGSKSVATPARSRMNVYVELTFDWLPFDIWYILI